jgi:hypothetical protein
LEVLDLDEVAPQDLGWAKPQRSRQALALLGAGRVAAVNDGLDHPFVQGRRLDQRCHAEAPLRHPFGDCLDLRHGTRPSPNAGQYSIRQKVASRRHCRA